jgi:SET domain-containing protein 6
MAGLPQYRSLLPISDPDILPERFDTPMFWNEEELKELKGTEVVSRIGKQKSEDQYTQLLLPLITSNPNLFDPEKCDINVFHRMGSIVLAYSFGSSDSSDDESEPGEAEIAMVPLADMLNANPELNNAFTCYCIVDFRRDYFKVAQDGK